MVFLAVPAKWPCGVKDGVPYRKGHGGWTVVTDNAQDKLISLLVLGNDTE